MATASESTTSKTYDPTKPISPSNPLTGRCFCAAVRYTLPHPPIESHLCHCHDCRFSSGSSFAHNAIFPSDGLVITTKGNVPIDSVLTSFGDEETGMKQFCKICGSPLFLLCGKGAQGMEGKMLVTVGSVEGSERSEELRPRNEGFVMRREGWMKSVEGAKEFERWE